MGKNVVEIEGNISKDIVLMGEKGKFCFISIAVNRANGGADFISVKAFKYLAISCAETLKKGDSISVTGHVSTGSYEKDNVKHYTTDIVVDKVRKLSKLAGNAVEVEVEENNAEVNE